MRPLHFVIFLFVLITLVNSGNSRKNRRVDKEDSHLTVPELIVKYGYLVEVHHVTTADGYILEMHRIPYGKKSGAVKKKKVVLVQHGLISSSADWVIAGPEKGLGYLLADLGYDVWLGNNRGNTYSKNHTRLNPKSGKFWDFSWHQIGIFDLPAMIDYALTVSGQKQTFYIGHSQGTTSFFVMCSEKPEYNAKIIAHFSLAPIAYMGHMSSPLLQIIANFEGPTEIILGFLGVREFLPSTELLAEAGKLFCSEDSGSLFLCTNAMFVVCGFSTKQMDTELLPVIMGHSPAGSSTKQFLHYAQLIKSKQFRRWDYGLLNYLHYHKLTPPKYNLSKVTSPVALFYSHNDLLAAEVDVLKLYNELGNPIGRFLVTDKTFNHLDYMWGLEAVEMVYKKVFALMERY